MCVYTREAERKKALLHKFTLSKVEYNGGTNIQIINETNERKKD